MGAIIEKRNIQALKLINNIASSNEILSYQIDRCLIGYEYFESLVVRNRAKYLLHGFLNILDSI